jgi:hypothetical protein
MEKLPAFAVHMELPAFDVEFINILYAVHHAMNFIHSKITLKQLTRNN